MSNDWLEEQALKFEGFTDPEIVEIKAAIPKLAALIPLYQKNQGDLEKAIALWNQLAPVAEMVATKLKGRLV